MSDHIEDRALKVGRRVDDISSRTLLFLVTIGFASVFAWQYIKSQTEANHTQKILLEEARAYQANVLEGMSAIEKELSVQMEKVNLRHNILDEKLTVLSSNQFILARDVTQVRTILKDIGLLPLDIDSEGRLYLQPRAVREQVFGESKLPKEWTKANE